MSQKVFYTIEELKEIVSTEAGRRHIADWVKENLEPLEDNNVFYSLVKKGGYELNKSALVQIIHALRTYADAGTRGHGKGHHVRDFLHAYVLATDTFNNSKIAPAEALAGFLAGAYHELGISFMVRYHDTKYCIDHGAAGAWTAFHIFRQFLPEHIALIIAYNINLHSHYLKEITATEDGDVRKTWNDALFERDGYLVRMSVWLTRFADRLDNLAHFARHIDANADGYLVGGANLRPDGGWNKLDMSKVRSLLIPAFVTETGDATTFKHVLGYGASAFAGGVYDKHDHLVPAMVDLKLRKLAQIVVALNTMLGKPADNEAQISDLVAYLNKIEMNPMEDSHFQIILSGWETLSSEEKKIWAALLPVLNKSYDEWFAYLVAKAQNSNLFPGLNIVDLLTA